MREVKIEMLRQGPAHNQLLSPLTEYLVLCGNRPADSLRIGFEHQEFLAHLSSLRYEREGAYSDQRFHLDRMRTLVGGIINKLGDLEGGVDMVGGGWLNMRLVISPAELSILPFEIAKSPDSFPGAELPLLLNPHRPVVVTREIRQNGSRAFTWPDEPRILVAATDLPGAPVPIKAHLLALRRALDPWMPPNANLRRWIRVIERASLESIISACDEESFTHVHILAHGDTLKNGANGFGLVLHEPRGTGLDVVDGSRLAEALCRPADHGRGHRRPAVVFLASCDSGARSELWYTGASMAQVLHGAGIPLVVASQFPLSKVGSVILTEELYRRLFAGEDPRQALYFARRKLQVRVPLAHDYFSLVAYAGLPEDLETQLAGVRLRRTLGQLKASKEWAPWNATEDVGESEIAARGNAYMHRLAQAEKKLTIEWEDIEAVRNPDGAALAEVCGLLGSTYKRRAELEFNGVEKSSGDRTQAGAKKSWLTTLGQARAWYKRGSVVHVGAGTDFVSHWNAVQSLALSAVIDGSLLGMDHLWRRARASAEAAAHDPMRPEDQVWAWGSLAELWMLRPLTAPTFENTWEQARKTAGRLIEEFKRRADPGSFFIQTTRDQLARYTSWWGRDGGRGEFSNVVSIAQDLLDRLSSPIEPRSE